MVQIMQNKTKQPSAIVCLAYRQMSTMTGIQDPIEQSKLEQMKQETEQVKAVVKTSFMELTNVYMHEVSKNMTESFRSMLDNLKVQIEQFREQSIFDLFSLPQLQKWFEREQ